jgi:hypothetical protein
MAEETTTGFPIGEEGVDRFQAMVAGVLADGFKEEGPVFPSMAAYEEREAEREGRQTHSNKDIALFMDEFDKIRSKIVEMENTIARMQEMIDRLLQRE